MDLIKKEGPIADINISLKELLIFSNSLNEVCNGLSQSDFETRMGAKHFDVQSLLCKVGSIIDEIGKDK